MSAEMIDEKSIFNKARKIEDATQRENYLQSVCADNPEAMQRIRDLLKVHAQEQSFLELPAAGLEQTIVTPVLSARVGGAIVHTSYWKKSAKGAWVQSGLRIRPNRSNAKWPSR